METTLRAGRLALVVVEEDQVDVGAEVELLAAQLPQAQDDEPRGQAPRGHRDAVALLGVRPGQADGRLGAGVGQVREVLGDHLQREAADDVVVADPQALAAAETAEGQLLLLLGRQRRDRRPELLDQGGPVAALRAGAEPVEQVGVADQDLAEILAGAEDLEEDLGGPRLADELVERLVEPADRAEEALEVRQRHAGVGAPRQDGVELRGDPRDPVEPLGPGAAGEVDQVARPRSASRMPSPESQPSSNSGIS